MYEVEFEIEGGKRTSGSIREIFYCSLTFSGLQIGQRWK